MDHKLVHQFYLMDGSLGVTPPLTGQEPNPLELSIQKWKTIVVLLEAGNFLRHCGGRRTCALCKPHMENSCIDCPIFLTTGRPVCVATPYDDFEHAKTIKEKLVAAKAEVDFLKSLREEK